MKTTAPRSLLLLAVIACLPVFASAQITTFTTIPSYAGSEISGGAGKAFTQSFTNVLGVQSMTYRFVRSAGLSTTNVAYYFVEWDTATNKATSLISNGTLAVPGVSSFTTYYYNDPIDGPIAYQGYDYMVNLNATSLNATKTYAMVLLNQSTNLKLQLIDAADHFQWGSAYTGTGITNYTTLSTTSSTAYPAGADWGFAQIVVDLAPIPEPATAAAGIGAVLVAGLVALRLMQRRRAAALVPIPVAAA